MIVFVQHACMYVQRSRLNADLPAVTVSFDFWAALVRDYRGQTR